MQKIITHVTVDVTLQCSIWTYNVHYLERSLQKSACTSSHKVINQEIVANNSHYFWWGLSNRNGCFLGEILTQKPHDVCVLHGDILLLHWPVVLLHKHGKLVGGPSLGNFPVFVERGQQHQVPFTVCTAKLGSVDGLGVAPNSVRLQAPQSY